METGKYIKRYKEKIKCHYRIPISLTVVVKMQPTVYDQKKSTKD